MQHHLYKGRVWKLTHGHFSKCNMQMSDLQITEWVIFFTTVDFSLQEEDDLQDFFK